MVTREKIERGRRHGPSGSSSTNDPWLMDDVLPNEHGAVLAATLGVLFMIAFSVIFTVPGLLAQVHGEIVSLPCLPETIAAVQVALQ
jgi:hypothetical protein